MDIHEATRRYETWMRRHLDVVSSDLRLKHERMAESAFVFLRATFYRWLQNWPEVCPDLLAAPTVLAVGDLHVENFGTWRDVEGRLIWGVNDVDEANRLPYTQDLVRLAASALLAIRAGRFTISSADACEAIESGYAASLDTGGRAFVVAERHRWLRDIAVSVLRDPAAFWAKLDALPVARGRAPHAALRSFMPARSLPYRVVRRVAGVGSLGRPRWVALADWGGGLIAREAKAVLPSAAEWLRPHATSAIYCNALIKRAVRMPDPFFTVTRSWIVRRLAPDCTRIELDALPRERDELRLLRAMGWETANLHLGTPGTHVARDLARRPRSWLARGASDMVAALTRDWRDWRR
jgi:hypothetical protein